MEFVHQQGETWGRIVRGLEQVAVPRFAEDLPRIIGGRAGRSLLAVGNRRSYGDSALNSEGGVVSMTALDRFIAFDREKAVLRVEAGATLGEIMRYIVPRGFFVPVTPGTRFVTVGGAIAYDV